MMTITSGTEPLTLTEPLHKSHTGSLTVFFFLWAPDGDFPSMQHECFCSTHIPAALYKRGYHSGVNVATALSSITTLFDWSALESSDLRFSSITSSVHSPSGLLLAHSNHLPPSSINAQPFHFSYISDTDWLNRWSSRLADDAAVQTDWTL